ncbi:archaetidylserine decarboxylase [Myxococcota bacterium]|nr:archaetidylserine decarboxylase [Myxococcota bacterium]
MKDALIVTALSVVPKNPVARLMGRTARLRLPGWLHRAVVGWFVRKYRVDLSECQGQLQDFPTLADLFVRPLRPGVRPIDPRPEVLVSPVDARVHTLGTVAGGRFAQADGIDASVAELVGPGGVDAAPDARRYEGGSYAILYLSPRDYHRVHTPRAGTVSWLRYLPGTLWPVFPAATRKVEGLFGRNERLVFRIDTDLGPILQVMVGAFGVGRMTTVVSDITTNTDGLPADRALTPAPSLDRCAELGRFELGSTVILLLEPGKVEWTVQPGDPVRLGRPIARVLPTRT